MLHNSIGIGIARGQYYWILGALFGVVLTLETRHMSSQIIPASVVSHVGVCDHV